MYLMKFGKISTNIIFLMPRSSTKKNIVLNSTVICKGVLAFSFTDILSFKNNDMHIQKKSQESTIFTSALDTSRNRSTLR